MQRSGLRFVLRPGYDAITRARVELTLLSIAFRSREACA